MQHCRHRALNRASSGGGNRGGGGAFTCSSSNVHAGRQLHSAWRLWHSCCPHMSPAAAAVAVASSSSIGVAAHNAGCAGRGCSSMSSRSCTSVATIMCHRRSHVPVVNHMCGRRQRSPLCLCRVVMHVSFRRGASFRTHHIAVGFAAGHCL